MPYDDPYEAYAMGYGSYPGYGPYLFGEGGWGGGDGGSGDGGGGDGGGDGGGGLEGESGGGGDDVGGWSTPDDTFFAFDPNDFAIPYEEPPPDPDPWSGSLCEGFELSYQLSLAAWWGSLSQNQAWQASDAAHAARDLALANPNDPQSAWLLAAANRLATSAAMAASGGGGGYFYQPGIIWDHFYWGENNTRVHEYYTQDAGQWVYIGSSNGATVSSTGAQIGQAPQGSINGIGTAPNLTMAELVAEFRRDRDGLIQQITQYGDPTSIQLTADGGFKIRGASGVWNTFSFNPSYAVVNRNNPNDWQEFNSRQDMNTFLRANGGYQEMKARTTNIGDNNTTVPPHTVLYAGSANPSGPMGVTALRTNGTTGSAAIGVSYVFAASVYHEMWHFNHFTGTGDWQLTSNPNMTEPTANQYGISQTNALFPTANINY